MMGKEQRWFAGIDWESQEHVVSLYDEIGEKIGQRKFLHDGTGLTDMIAWLLKASGGKPGEIQPHPAFGYGPYLERAAQARSDSRARTIEAATARIRGLIERLQLINGQLAEGGRQLARLCKILSTPVAEEEVRHDFTCWAKYDTLRATVTVMPEPGALSLIGSSTSPASCLGADNQGENRIASFKIVAPYMLKQWNSVRS
jgi:hypothetical protein